MRNRIIRFLKELPSDFSTNELAFYALTNRFELHLRDKLAFKLQMQLKRAQVFREWKYTDISIHRNGREPVIIELKYGLAAMLLRRREIQKAGLLLGLKRDLQKSQRISKDCHGIVLFSCPTNQIPEKYKSSVKNFATINKYCEVLASPRKWRIELIKRIEYHFPQKTFSIKAGTLYVGKWFETHVNLIWVLISRKT